MNDYQNLLQFSLIEGYIDREEYSTGANLEEEIGAMLWTELNNLENSIKK